MAECDKGVALLLGDYGPAATTLVTVGGLDVVSFLIDADGDDDKHWRGTSTCDMVLTWGEATHDSTILVRYVRGDGLEEIFMPRQREPN